MESSQWPSRTWRNSCFGCSTIVEAALGLEHYFSQARSGPNSLLVPLAFTGLRLAGLDKRPQIDQQTEVYCMSSEARPQRRASALCALRQNSSAASRRA
jgi:hypothetical protein